ncbi:MAG: hypothetical protein M1837_006845 [Sclerophora amabilis]|nr:MAG: hypothetical protein M1837_006845 [Sclerophora amabilis]
MNRWPSRYREPSSRKPLVRLATRLYEWRLPTETEPELSEDSITIVCVSDTHTTRPILPHGDLLLHAGDLSETGSFDEIQAQLDWLNAQPHKHKVIIGGNHDLLLDLAFVDRFPERVFERPGASRSDLRWGSVNYLQDESITLRFRNGRSLNVYGSPWTQQYGTWAFQYPPIRNVWTGVVPDDTDILLTHGPPKFHLDQNVLGNAYLLKELCRVRPRLVVFGHIHGGYGQEVVAFDALQSAFESVRIGDGGIMSVSLMLFHMLLEWIWFALGRAAARPAGMLTRLVNAAAVGGPRNRDRRSPITVHV